MLVTIELLVANVLRKVNLTQATKAIGEAWPSAHD